MTGCTSISSMVYLPRRYARTNASRSHRERASRPFPPGPGPRSLPTLGRVRGTLTYPPLTTSAERARGRWSGRLSSCGSQVQALLDAMPGGWGRLRAWVRRFNYPKGYASPIAIFTQNSLGKASASEQLALAAPLRLWLITISAEPAMRALPLKLASGIRLCDVVERLMETKRAQSTTTPASLEDTILRHLLAQRDAWGLACWIPKCHFSMHLPKHWEQHGVLLSTFLHERHHKDRAEANTID